MQITTEEDLDAEEYRARADLARAARTARVRGSRAAQQAHVEAARKHARVKVQREILRWRELPLTEADRAELADLLRTA